MAVTRLTVCAGRRLRFVAATHSCRCRGSSAASRRLEPDAERPLQLGIGGAFCGSPGGEPWTGPGAGPVDPRADDPTGAGPDIAALPRQLIRLGRPCGPTAPAVTRWPDPVSCLSGSILWLPFGSGAPHGVVREFYARSARPRKGFEKDSRELSSPTDSSTERHARVPNVSPESSTAPVNKSPPCAGPLRLGLTACSA